MSISVELKTHDGRVLGRKHARAGHACQVNSPDEAVNLGNPQKLAFAVEFHAAQLAHIARHKPVHIKKLSRTVHVLQTKIGTEPVAALAIGHDGRDVRGTVVLSKREMVEAFAEVTTETLS